MKFNVLEETETVYDPDNPVQFSSYKDFVDKSQFQTFDEFESFSNFRIEKSNKSHDMLQWKFKDGYGFISLWFNSLTGKVITNFEIKEEYNMNHRLMVHNVQNLIPNPFYIDFSNNDIDLYDIVMRYHWIRIGTATSGKEWYVDNKYWEPYMKVRLQALFQQLLSTGVVSYSTNSQSQPLAISNPNAMIMFDPVANIPIQTLGNFSNSDKMGWDMKKHSDGMSVDGKTWEYNRIGDSIVRSNSIITEKLI